MPRRKKNVYSFLAVTWGREKEEGGGLEQKPRYKFTWILIVEQYVFKNSQTSIQRHPTEISS